MFRFLKRTVLILLLLVILVPLIFVAIGYLKGFFSEKIGVIEIEGVIRDGRDILSEMERFRERDDIKGLILRIDSPGGAVGPSQEIYREVRRLREKKKVFASFGSLGTSGAYYIASAAERIYANPSTITGSIGVILSYMDVEELLKRIGIRAGSIKSGEFKDVGSPLRGMKEEEKRYLASLVKEIHERFVKDVAEARLMDIEKVRALADGRIYTGVTAKSLGLVDRIGSFHEALEDMRVELRLKGKPTLVYGKKRFSLFRFLFGDAIEALLLGTDQNDIRYLFLYRG